MTAASFSSPLATLGFSEEFLESCNQMGYSTMNDILSDKQEIMVERSGFSYHWLSELGRYLKGTGELMQLQRIQGNTPS